MREKDGERNVKKKHQSSCSLSLKSFYVTSFIYHLSLFEIQRHLAGLSHEKDVISKSQPKTKRQKLLGSVILDGKFSETKTWIILWVTKIPKTLWGYKNVMLAFRWATAQFTGFKTGWKRWYRMCHKTKAKTPSHEENQPRKRQDVRSAQEDLQEKMWDVGERGFLPAMDPVKDLPSPWDELVIIMDYVPSFSVQGHGGMGVCFFFQGLKKPAPLHSFRFSKRKNDTLLLNVFHRPSKKTLAENSYLAGRFREVADSELQDHLPKSWAQVQKATKNLTEGELECVLDSELVAGWSWGASLFVIEKEGNSSEVWGKLFEKGHEEKKWGACHMQLDILAQAHTWEEKRGKSFSSSWLCSIFPSSVNFSPNSQILQGLHSVLGYACLAYLHSPPDIYEQDVDQSINIMGRPTDTDTLPVWLSRSSLFMEGSWWALSFQGSRHWKCLAKNPLADFFYAFLWGGLQL